MSTSADVVVLGAGPAGLSAAWRAARRGFSVRVLEREQRVGGMAASFEVAGQRVDHGSHRLSASTPPRLLDDLEQLLDGDLQTRRRNGRLQVGDTWVSMPLSPTELLRVLPPGMRAGIARDAVTRPVARSVRRAVRGASRVSYESELRASVGPTVYDAVHGPYARKLWGLAGTEISADQARRRVAGSTAWAVLGRALRGGRRKSLPGTDRTFYYPRRGFGQIVERLADAAVDAGADIVLGADVEGVSPSFDDVSVHTGAGDETTAGIAFSTLPFPLLARITSPGPSLTAIEAASRLRFRAMVLVYVVHKGERWTPYDAFHLSGPETPVTRISEPANFRDNADDPKDLSVVCAEVPCSVGDERWNLDADGLALLVDDAVERLGLPPLQRAEVAVRRLPNAYPIFELGYERRLAGIEAWITGVPQILSFGRSGLFAHDNTHHAMLEAYEAVDALGPDGRFDATRWRVQRRRFAEHVVED